MSGVNTCQLNCNLEFFPDMALAQAKGLDDYYAKHKKPIGPLHGLPISLKDQLRIKVCLNKCKPVMNTADPR